MYNKLYFFLIIVIFCFPIILALFPWILIYWLPILVLILVIIIIFKVKKIGNFNKFRKILLEYPNNGINTYEIINLIAKNKEDNYISVMIEKELIKNNYTRKNNLKIIIKRKFILTIIFSTINFSFLVGVFFHFPIYIYFLELLNIILYIVFMKKINVINVIKKEIKSRPTENISYIISSMLNGNIVYSSGKFKNCIFILVSIVLPLFIFFNPHILYEKVDGGYYVRFYTIGITNYQTVTIPDEYKGEKVIGIRGNVFKNMVFLKEIKLPDTIQVIRGGAFENVYNLTAIDLPKDLIYLGGSAFKNCRSLKSITIPSGVKEINGNTFENCYSLEDINLHNEITSIHGEVFKNCTSLVKINLPSKITEIRGSTFEGCTALKEIDIPSGVTRIGGHAFHGCSSLTKVSVPSTVEEIGSSAFRACTSLYSIKIPKNAIVNERAFKESPTSVSYIGEDNPTYNNNNNSVDSKTYTLYLNQEKYINDELRITLISFTDTTHDENIFIGMSGTIKIVTKKDTYYFDFQTSSPQNYKYIFEGYTLEVKSGMDNYIKIIFR